MLLVLLDFDLVVRADVTLQNTDRDGRHFVVKMALFIDRIRRVRLVTRF